MKEKNEGQLVFTALIVTLLLHGVVFAVVGYYMTGQGKVEKVIKNKPETVLYPVSLERLPEINKQGDKSVINKKAGEKEEQLKKSEAAMAYAKQHVESNTAAAEEMLRYQDMIRRRIEASRKYPEAAKKQGTEGKVEIEFILNREGTLINVSLTGTSGSDMLDKEAIDTIKRASPYGPLPKEYTAENMDMQVVIVYKLN